ncbi:MAG: hypothetical protein INR69_22325 [Mucilaginibacter polytrichastri]|nr:hypothetical protein [Mucilaginibacter polytrichastri]
MNSQTFIDSLEKAQPGADLSVHLQSLWYDARGDWRKAHDLIDQLTDKTSARVHAYLHRKEGDIWNADYWYSRAGEKRPDVSLDEEWTLLVNRLTD